MIIESEGFSIKLARKKVKNFNLRIHRSGEIQLSIPMRLPLYEVHGFIQQKKSWIKQHQNIIQSKQISTNENLLEGDLLFFLGQSYCIKIHIINDKPRIELSKNSFHFFVNEGISTEKKQKLLNVWYRSKIQEYLPGLIAKWENTMDLQANSYTIRSMKSRWGSCNTIKKKICLNLRLIEKPLVCLEYVLVHELVHLWEPSHNQRFYSLQSRYMPDWKDLKKLLENT